MEKENKTRLEVRSVYADLGYKNYSEMETKSNLVMEISEVIKKKKLTQSQAAELFGLSQPKLSELLSGRFRGYSVERLMHFLTVLGKDVDILVKDRPLSRSARIVVRCLKRGRTRRAASV
jgi:predicted XRE-type DNA-binding protein